MTQPAQLPIVGDMQFTEVQKGSLIDYWRDVERSTGVIINFGERLDAIAEENGTTVTLSYRSSAFSRAKPKNRQRVEEMAAAGRLRVLFSSNVKSIREDVVHIAYEGRLEEIANDVIVISAGRHPAKCLSQNDWYSGRDEMGN